MAVVDKEKIESILAMLKNLEYGSLVITIHAGYITQIDRTEKYRFAAENSSVNKKSSST
ncbi:YezD family protein [Neobacillus cucumis]|uniref:DUF2292 domain-containing protein n=1 Tax=Neobacillus cucumis TaxID=1740721 RepID=A0A2N5HAV4_9BACI|nr:YezD family protein [Neobacillus cucumis]PLS02661.1 DUF2292 domain-containing protein [Neobacillus cucumis]